MDLFNWISLGVAPVSSIITWFAARRVRNNSTLQDMQGTVNMLVKTNTELYETVVKQEGAMAEMKIELITLRNQVKQLTTTKTKKKQP